MLLINNEILFLIVIGLIWVIGAVLQDLRRREVDNLWNFSLIAFALAYRASVSVYTGNHWFIINGLIGFGIFLALGNLFYYSRLFAGGDAKLLIALGTILPLSFNWISNFKIFLAFILLFLVTGSIYALIWAIFLVFRKWKRFIREFKKQFKKFKRTFWLTLIVVVILSFVVLFFGQIGLIVFPLIIILFPVLFIFAKTVEESCMVVPMPPEKVTEGDWLYNDISVSGQKIRSNWEGVSKRELGLIKNHYRGKVMIKQGIPFTPAFLFALIGLIYLLWKFWIWF